MVRRRLSLFAIAAAMLVAAITGGLGALQQHDAARPLVAVGSAVHGAPHVVDALMPASARDRGVAELRGLRGRHLDQGIKLGLGLLATIVAIGALCKRRAVTQFSSAFHQSGSGHRLGRGPPALLLI